MARTKRAQVLMEPAEYEQLEAIARRKKRSVADLVREAVHDKYFVGTRDKREVVTRIRSYRVPITEDWDAIKQDLQQGYDEDLP